MLPEDDPAVNAQSIWITGTGSKSGTPRYIDARVKPDVVCPSAGSWTRLLAIPRTPASSSDPAYYLKNSGSSGAPPVAAGMAQIVWFFLSSTMGKPPIQARRS